MLCGKDILSVGDRIGRVAIGFVERINYDGTVNAHGLILLIVENDAGAKSALWPAVLLVFDRGGPNVDESRWTLVFFVAGEPRERFGDAEALTSA